MTTNTASCAVTDKENGAGQNTETITCKRCGQEMESADAADGCEDFHCPMKN